MATTQQPTETKTTSQLKQKLQERLEEAKQRLQKAKEDISNLREEDKANIRQKRDEIQKRIDEQEKRAKDLRTQVSEWLKDKKDQTDEQIASWRQKQEQKHLDRRADRAEDYAVNALIIAMMDADEAEIAVLDALDARLDANTARPSA